MPEERPELDPLRLQLQTTNRLFLQAERVLAITETHTIIPNRTWAQLAMALSDLAACARRTL